ncbi:cellulose synthase [Caballeronia sp. KNU42]
MSSKQKLTIIAINVRSGVAQKTGRPYTIHEAQCILEQSKDGVSNVVVGVINLPDVLAKEVQPGDYLAEFLLAQGSGQDAGRLVPRITSLVPHGNPRPQPKPEAKAA